MTIIKNVTPHDVTLVNENGETIRVFPREGVTIRLQSQTVTVGEIDGVRLTNTVYGKPVLVNAEGIESPMPEVEDGVYYIVSAMAKAAMPDRKDLLVPAEQKRDAAGRIIGAMSLGV